MPFLSTPPDSERDPGDPREPSPEGLLLRVLDALSAHVAVLDEAGVVVAANVAWLDFARDPAGELDRFAVGADYFRECERVEGPCADDVRALARGVRAVLEGDRESFATEYPHGAGGEECWYAARVCRAGEPGSPRVVIVHEAVSPRPPRHPEAALREQERYFRALIENASDMITVLDAGAVVRFESPAVKAMLGYEPSEREGRSAFDLLHPDDLDAVRAAFGEALESPGKLLSIEARLRTREGEWSRLELRGRNLLHDPSVRGVVINSRDVTEARVREAQLRRTERLASLGTLVAGVAHELNNPLAAIKSFAQLLLLDERPEEDREGLEMMEREAERAARIVADLRQLARVSQQPEEKRVAVDLNEVVREVLRLRRYPLASRGVQVSEELAADLPPVLGDRGQIEQLVLNLVVNAEQAMEDHPGARRLVVGTVPGSRRVTLVVRDSGPGVPAEHLDRIFDAFFTTRPPGHGIGLGLSLAHSIATRHGGDLRVESEPGAGAAFTAELPSLPAPSPLATLPRTSAVRVLVVDDEPSIRHTVGRYLERRGYAVDEAVDGGEALRRLETGGYDVVISDLRMPGVDGPQLLHRLRERGDGYDFRLAFITGDLDSVELRLAVQGADIPVLLKPFGLEEVERVVEAILARNADR